eukprot:CAMPEP_0176115934 /NCGR_PEP_ID=MMETSP0120_2-20121206/58223_1 /TAXON_ID=160619 /ORGANISM="Kryptoperidinium foliaceum, Strain CCMP 1326" /LENGTH=60 /DNA_ID=CAMNT_0017450179 /DNA_START=147 /DNA_END=326 /DNA_ORIENTATION=+
MHMAASMAPPPSHGATTPRARGATGCHDWVSRSCVHQGDEKHLSSRLRSSPRPDNGTASA